MEFRLPELGEGVHEGELVKWLVKPGDVIKDDQPLCEIMTDKATMEIPSPFAGTIESVHAKEGEVVKVNQLMVTAKGAGDSKSSSPSAPASTSTKAVGVAPSAALTSAPAAAFSNSKDVLASPATRKLAREQGVDLGSIAASGPHGRVLQEDVEKFISGGNQATRSGGVSRNTGVASTREDRIAFRGLRKKISEKMRLSKDKAAHFTYVEEADVTELVKLRAAAKPIAEAQGIKLTYLPIVMKAMVAALRKHPSLNSMLDEAAQEIVVKHYYNIGLSVQTADGLTAPVIKNVESKSILQIAQEIQDVVARARAKKLTMEDLTGGTITLTNAGSIGGLFATPVINFPEVSILGFNKISRKPVVKTIKGVEKVVIRDWTYFSISLDHRIVDGAEAAEFMKTFIQYIEAPNLLLLESL
jgi:pyruvate dehydrogenase E2 component (dihydrolipoamide acetyltransferase)